MKYDYNDILISPSIVTDINSRSSVDNFHYTGILPKELPIIASPMDTVVSLNNISDFSQNYIPVCLPRNYYNEIKNNFGDYELLLMRHSPFISLGIDEFEFLINFYSYSNLFYNRFLIDIANGHIKKLQDLISEAKNKFSDKITIMSGNVAHPETYKKLSDAGSDYVRIGIGNGNACLTTQQTGIGYPQASLIRECYEASLELSDPAKIISDGGIRAYSDIIKALALGADYVMLGSLLNKSLEASGKIYWNGIHIKNKKIIDFLFRNKYTLYRNFRGMSSKEVQKEWGKGKLKTSEGINKHQKIEYNLRSWSENFIDYLRSAMSYCNSRTLSEFIGNQNIIHITNNAYQRFNK